jgi:hypothetical protein
MTDDYPAHPRLELETAEVVPTFRPADIKVIQAIVGRSPFALLQADDDDGGRFQVMAFMELRKRYPDEYTKTLWDLAEQSDIVVTSTPAEDPTRGGTSTESPLSAPTSI